MKKRLVVPPSSKQIGNATRKLIKATPLDMALKPLDYYRHTKKQIPKNNITNAQKQYEKGYKEQVEGDKMTAAEYNKQWIQSGNYSEGVKFKGINEKLAQKAQQRATNASQGKSENCPPAAPRGKGATGITRKSTTNTAHSRSGYTRSECRGGKKVELRYDGMSIKTHKH